MGSHTIRIALLDGFAIDGEPREGGLSDLSLGMQRLLAHVSLSRRPARGATAGLLWPDLTEEKAQSSLRSTLWRLQKHRPGLITISPGALQLHGGVEVDVHELEVWAREILSPDADVHQMRLPEVAFRGELLPGWYDDWVLLERERLRQLRLHALEVLADRLAIADRFGEAIQAALAAVAAEPLRESAHRAVVRVHLAEGNVVEAIRVYCGFRDLLAQELGVTPSAQMRELMRGLRVPAASRSRPDSTKAKSSVRTPFVTRR